MSVWQEFLIAAIVIVSVVLQFGERPLNWFRVALPLVIVTGFAIYYLKGIPTSGGDAWFTLGGLAAGLVTGVVAAALMGMRRENGRLIVSAGMVYVAFWVAIFGARLGFAVIATQSPDTLRNLFIWSYQHGITELGWTAALFAQAIAMVGLRTVIVAVRAMLLRRHLAPVAAA
jgi:hypothetical protein